MGAREATERHIISDDAGNEASAHRCRKIRAHILSACDLYASGKTVKACMHASATCSSVASPAHAVAKLEKIYRDHDFDRDSYPNGRNLA